MPVPSVGSLVADRYRLEQQVGEGGMGSVWVAEDEKLERWVAVKLLGERCAASRGARERFEREAMAIAKLRSPHIVQVFDYGTEGGQAFMAMELLSGIDLFTWLGRNRGAPLHKIVRVVVQVARALAAAHRAGIIHRDLKPANIFVVKDHEEENVKVFDFGLAKRLQELGPKHDVRDATADGVLLGTPRYMSPEQAHGARRVDHRSDLWSLGVIAYLAVTGRLPFDGKGVGDIITKIATAAHRPPSQILTTLPAAVDVFFDRALAKSPDARFQSAQELAEAFERLVDAHVSLELIPLIDPDTIADLEALNEADTELGDHAIHPPPTSWPEGIPRDDTTLPRPPSVEDRGSAAASSRWMALIGAALVLAVLAVALTRERAQEAALGVAPLVVPPPRSPEPGINGADQARTPEDDARRRASARADDVSGSSPRRRRAGRPHVAGDSEPDVEDGDHGADHPTEDSGDGGKNDGRDLDLFGDRH